MRTTLDLDKTLMDRLVKESHAASKTEAIHLAAQEFLNTLARRKLIKSFGTWDIAPVYKETRRMDAKDGQKTARQMKSVKFSGR